MTQTELEYILGIAGGAIVLLLGVVGYFLKIIHKDVKENTQDKGKLKGKIEQLELQLIQEKQIREMEINNQNASMKQAIEVMAEKVGELSEDVKMLIKSKIA